MNTATLDSATDVLASIGAAREMRDRGELDILIGALRWADQHPAESIHDAHARTSGPICGGERAVLGGAGTPAVDRIPAGPRASPAQ